MFRANLRGSVCPAHGMLIEVASAMNERVRFKFPQLLDGSVQALLEARMSAVCSGQGVWLRAGVSSNTTRCLVCTVVLYR